MLGTDFQEGHKGPKPTLGAKSQHLGNMTFETLLSPF